MLRSRLTSIRGQLVVWYLFALAVLLVALGVVQVVTLRTYLRSSTAESLRRSGYASLAVLGPCYLRSSSDLTKNALTLARLLGGHEVAVMILTPSGATLANHGLGPAGAAKPLKLSEATIRRLIGTAGTTPVPTPQVRLARCPRPAPSAPTHEPPPQPWSTSIASANDILLVAVPLGPFTRPVGFAILGRSMADANRTVARVLAVFGLGAAIALLLAALVALPIINRALRPLRRVTHTAEAIAAGDLSQRAQIAHSHDEVGRLGQAFDRMVDRLQVALRTAAASEERMRDFLADASHELRTPVTVLRGASQVLLRANAGADPELVDGLSDMHAEAVRLAHLVDDLLTLSRLDGGYPLVPTEVELRPFLEGFLERYGAAWPGRPIALQVEGLGTAAVAVDPEALSRVLTNLVDNAARYSRLEGDITIRGEGGQDSITLEVADEGPGMSEEDAAHAFDRFYRAHKSRSRASGGTGLGLAIVRRIVERSGGTIDLHTGPDRGTTISLSLPRHKSPANGAASEAGGRERRASAGEVAATANIEPSSR